ncbi:PP-loop family-domain-containing protein [Linnemannia elongata]|nr:PP-loop family-domain-containing protein [Linnemannia elongata]
MKIRTTGLAAITAKEFAQWISLLESAAARATAIRHRQHQYYQSASSLAAAAESQKEQLFGNGGKDAPEQNVGIAVSGGVDSMALATLLARHYSLQSRGSIDSTTTKLHAFIVDHKLRDNSTEEANYVAQQVQKLNVIPHVLSLDWSIPDSLELDHNLHQDSHFTEISQIPDKTHLETKARLRRYKTIAQKCHDLSIEDLFVGHHAGDQVETTLFRFSRASGIDGLAGIQSIAPLGVVACPEALDIRVVRPLLQVSKDRLRATCEEAGTLWVEDPSNKSLDYQRNVIRHYQQHQDSLTGVLEDSQGPGVHPLSTTAMLAFRDRMNHHRQAAWKQVTPWIKGIWFDNANGACHLRLESNTNSTLAGTGNASVEWLQASQNHVSTRLLSFLVRWVNCKDHNPRLEDIQTLQQHLCLQQQRLLTPELCPPMNSPSPNATRSDSNSPRTSASPTVYRKLKQRASKRASNTLETSQPNQQEQGQSVSSVLEGLSAPFVRTPITIAGVLISPPRKSKGVPKHWTISRQPMSHADQLSATVTVPLKDGVDVLWDRRFFLSISGFEKMLSPMALTGSADQVQIRSLNAKDVEVIRRRLQLHPQDQEADGLRRLKQWMASVPGKARFTIPIILSQYATQAEDNRGEELTVTTDILSVPTLGLHFGPTRVSFQSRFKSNPPANAKDMNQFPYSIPQTSQK